MGETIRVPYAANAEETGSRTTLISKNVTVGGRRTSIRLEPEMWMAIREISIREKCTIHDICTLVNIRKRPGTSLTAAIRSFLMLYFRAAATEDGHRKAGHGDFEFMRRRARVPAQSLNGNGHIKESRPDITGSGYTPGTSSVSL